MTLDAENFSPPGARIKIVGIGGAGGNAVNTMIQNNLQGLDFIVINTDLQSLNYSLANNKIQIGKDLTKGLGAGANPDVGRDAALEDRNELQEILSDADMIFITAGMGGGTGTGAASVIAQIAKELGALTVAVVTTPFAFEGKRRKRHADIGIERLREHVDTLITIPNQRLLTISDENISLIEAFKIADGVLVNAVRGISDIINVPGTINVDFADVKTVMSSMGQAVMGIGVAAGERRASLASKQAISSPLLEEINIEGATGILINVTAGESITLKELHEACLVVQDAAHEDANVIFGAVIDDNMGDEIRVTVIATGFPVEPLPEKVSKYPLQQISRNRQRATQQVPTQQVPTQQVPTQQVPTQQVPAQQAPTQQAPAQQAPAQQAPALPIANMQTPQVDLPQPTEQPPTVNQTHYQQQPVQRGTLPPVNKTLQPPVFTQQQTDNRQEPTYTQASKIANDIDNSIDEAIQLANNKQAKEQDLDVPTFVRTGMKELPDL